MRLAREIFLLEVKVVVTRDANDWAQLRKIDRLRRLVRFDLDGADARACLALDQHALAAAQRTLARQEIVQVTGLLETDRYNFRQRRRAFKRIDICHYLYSPRIACPAIVHQFSACMRGLAFSPTATLARTAASIHFTTASTARLSARLTNCDRASGGNATKSVLSNL